MRQWLEPFKTSNWSWWQWHWKGSPNVPITAKDCVSGCFTNSESKGGSCPDLQKVFDFLNCGASFIFCERLTKLATFQLRFPIFNFFKFFSIELYVSQLMIVFSIPALTLQVTLGDNCRELSFSCFSDCSYIERKISILSTLISMTEKSSL